MIQILLIEDIGPTLNEFYAGMHHIRRSEIKRAWRTMVALAVRAQKIQPVKEYPVSIDCRLVFGSKGRRGYDWENAAATVKLVQDGLHHAGILVDDSAKYVRGGRMWCVKMGNRDVTQFAIREGADAHLFG